MVTMVQTRSDQAMLPLFCAAGAGHFIASAAAGSSAASEDPMCFFMCFFRKILNLLQVSTLWWMFDIGQYSNTNSPAKHLQARSMLILSLWCLCARLCFIVSESSRNLDSCKLTYIISYYFIISIYI